MWFAGVRAESPASVEGAERTLSGWLADLGPVTYGDIAIRPFRADFDGVVFGLVDETTDDPYTGHGGPSSTPSASGSTSPGTASTTPGSALSGS